MKKPVRSDTKLKLTLAHAVIFVLALQATQAYAQRLSLSGGSGTDGDIYQLSLITHSGFWTHETSGGLKIQAHLESTLTQIDGSGAGGNKGITVVGLTPTLTLSTPKSPVYAEFGIGAHYFDQKEINSRKSVGTHFEFGDFLGVGVRLGARDQFELGYRVIHFSNAGMSSNNPGLDFHQIRFGLTF